MDWDGLNLRDIVLGWLEAADNEYRIREVKLDPYATSMRNFDDVAPHLSDIRAGHPPNHTDPGQRVTDLRSAGLVDASGTSLSELGNATLDAWEHFGVATDDLGDELARDLLLVLEGRRLQDQGMERFLSYWNDIRTYFHPITLITNWATLFELSYMDFERAGFRPGAVLRDEGVAAEDINFDLGDFARSVGASAKAISGAEKLESAIGGKLPRGRDRATFCMALEIVSSGGTSTAEILKSLGTPNPHTWSSFTETQKAKVQEILAANGAYADAAEPLEAEGAEPTASLEAPPLTPAPAPSLPANIKFENVLVPAPTPPVQNAAAGGGLGGGNKKVDHQKKAKKQDEVGKLGEKFALEYERWRLRNHPDLKKNIRHVSEDDDTLGYDIHSFEEDGSDRFVEVKGTLGPLEKRFFLSANELACAEAKHEKYVVLRVAQLTDNPKCCEVRYPFEGKLDLTPYTYSVGFAAVGAEVG